ncbi:MAG: LOG family protein [Chromatiales bacterium]|nr:LOG family protein [Chromatiales bacterium]
MTDKKARQEAYRNETFLGSSSARTLRILSEYVEPESRFKHYAVEDTIVFMGSARLKSREDAEAALATAQSTGENIATAQRDLDMSRYYEAARELAHRFTDWSKQMPDEKRRFVVCTGGGPGIMEAANRGASEAKGVNIGLTISIPVEEFDNAYVTRELSFHFHYFFMRKFWFAYLAKAVLVFPGGFGTLDELFELLTLLQTRKMRKHLPIVLFGSQFWRDVINFEALIRYGTISPGDTDLMFITDSVDEAYDYVVNTLERYGASERGARM